MADITRSCGHCGQNVTVSEYADMATLQCPTCGKGLGEVPAEDLAAQALEKGPGLRMKARDTAPEATPYAGQVDTLPLLKPDRVTLWLGPERWKALLPIAHWLVFAVLLVFLGMVFRLRFDVIVNWALNG